MTGRLLGATTLPPETPTNWHLKPATIYGCPLCHQLNTREIEPLWQVNPSTVDLESVDHDIYIVGRHGPSISIASVEAAIIPEWRQDWAISICMSMGHVYLSRTNFTLNSIPALEVDELTILGEDLPINSLIYHQGSFYNVAATIIADLTSDERLGSLATLHGRLESARDDSELYSQLRVDYISTLDDYLLPDGVSLDTSYGLRTLDRIATDAARDNPNIPLTTMAIQGAFGIVYTGKLRRDTLVYKYLDVSEQLRADSYAIEKLNHRYINDNLNQLPNLPYPYMFDSYSCGLIEDIEELTQPTCPRVDGDPAYALIVQSYINNIGTVYSLIKFLGLPLYIETVATLAEAHQGDTVQYHFMHLDAHGNNFLVSRCSPMDRICDLRHERRVNFGGLSYVFGTFGYRVYMVDFGFSHILGTQRNIMKGHVPESVPLGGTLYPAYDLINIGRSLLPILIRTILQLLVEAKHNNNDVLIARLQVEWQRFTKLLQIHASMLAQQIITVVKLVLQFTTIAPSAVTEGEDVNVLNFNELLLFLNDLSDLEVSDVQDLIVMVVDRLATELANLKLEDLSDPLYLDLIKVFTGSVPLFRSRGGYNGPTDNTYYQQFLRPLSDSTHEALGITESPSSELTGIPLYLWYLQAGGVIELP